MDKRKSERIKYWLQIALLPVYGISFLIPKNKKIWLFGCSFGNRFAENPRYLFLYSAQNQNSKVRSIWISKKPEIVRFLRENGYESYEAHSMRGIWYSLRAGAYIFDNYSKDINFWFSGGAVKINLWHGSGNKKTNYDNVFDKIRHPQNKWEKWITFLRRISDEKPTHYTLATSEAMAEIFISAFQTNREHILLEGYPRNDMLFEPEEHLIKNILLPKEQELKKQIQQYQREHKNVIAYMPTFRDSEAKFFEVMDLHVFNEYLGNKNLIFITKLHPKSKLKDKFEEIKYTNIINADAEIDIYTFLKEASILVTDYSSVYTDFMLLNRPVVAFHYDWELYSEQTRDSYIEHDQYMPEKKATTMEELMVAIDQVMIEDKYQDRRLQSRKRMFSSVDGKSSQRLFDAIYELVCK